MSKKSAAKKLNATQLQAWLIAENNLLIELANEVAARSEALTWSSDLGWLTRTRDGRALTTEGAHAQAARLAAKVLADARESVAVEVTAARLTPAGAPRELLDREWALWSTSPRAVLVRARLCAQLWPPAGVPVLGPVLGPLPGASSLAAHDGRQ